jgi:hypothetical protein
MRLCESNQSWSIGHDRLISNSSVKRSTSIIADTATADAMTAMTPVSPRLIVEQPSAGPPSAETPSAVSSQIVEQGSKLFGNLTKSFYVHTKTQVALQGAITVTLLYICTISVELTIAPWRNRPCYRQSRLHSCRWNQALPKLNRRTGCRLSDLA